MRKSIVLLCAAALALVACQKSPFSTDETAQNSGIRFRIATNNYTKSEPGYFNTAVDNLNGLTSGELRIRAVASLMNTDGTTISNDLFKDTSTDPAKPKMGWLSGDNTNGWFLTESQSTDPSNDAINPFPPFGGAYMNTLFLAAPDVNDLSSGDMRYRGDANETDYANAIDTGWSTADDAKWYPVFSDNNDLTKKVEFISVDTYANSKDLMYASSNDIKAGDEKTVLFNHAQALLIFNFNVSNRSALETEYSNGTKLGEWWASSSKAALLFVDPEAALNSDPTKKVKDLLTESNDPDGDFASEFQSASDVAKYLTLKTVGTFTYDNSRNTPVASWDLSKWGELDSYYSVIKSGVGSDFQYAGIDRNITSEDMDNPNHPNYNTLHNMNSYSDYYGLVYNTNLRDVTAHQAGDDPDWTNNPTNYVQVGQQFIPEQKNVNPWLLITLDGENFYLKEINIPRGTWQKGHVYIYNISLEIMGGTKFTVNVQPYENDNFTI